MASAAAWWWWWWLWRACWDSAAFKVLVTAAAVLYGYSTRTYGKWRTLGVPHPRPVPLFGDAVKRVLGLEKQTELFDRIYRRFPGARLCGFYQMRTPYLMVRDPALVVAVTVTDFAHFTDHGFEELDPSVNLLARSVFFSAGRRWRTMRQKLSPAFTSGRLRGTHGQITRCSEQLIAAVGRKLDGGGGQIEVKKMVGNFATDVIGTCAFGLTLDAIANDDSEFRRHASRLFRSAGPVQTLKNVVAMLCPRLARFLRVQLFPAETTGFFRSVFADVIRYRTDNKVVRNDLAQTLIQARNELVLNPDPTTVKDKFTDSDIIANAILLFSAGTDTVSITTSFCLYELALKRDIQDKLRAEINRAKTKYDGKFTNDFLMDLQYAEMVLNETLRKYSITIALLRVATQNYQVPGESLIIEKGQKLVIPSFSIHHDPEYYPNPDDFDPERFTPEEKSKRPNGTFIPFGEGPRQCIAKRFAELEMKLVLSEILSKFEILPCEKTEIPLEIKIGPGLLEPKNGIWLHFKPLVE